MQLRLDAADRLVELVEERRGPVVAEEAARALFALRQAPVALARTLLADVVAADARLAWTGDAVALARPLGAELLLEEATYVVVDLETTGLRPGSSQICACRLGGRSRRLPASPTGSCAAHRSRRRRCAAFSPSPGTPSLSHTTRASTSPFSTARPSARRGRGLRRRCSTPSRSHGAS